MRISEADKAMGQVYRDFKKANGGHKTAPRGKYGFKTLRFIVLDVEGQMHGPFKGRGSALTFYQRQINKAGKPTKGVKFYVQELYKPKDKNRPVVIDKEHEFEITTQKKVKK